MKEKRRMDKLWGFLVALIILTVILVKVVPSFYNDLCFIMADESRFDFDHKLPRLYEHKLTMNLIILRRGLFLYCQHHKGKLPPMANSAQVRRAILPFVRSYQDDFSNPMTLIPLSPNQALSRMALRDVPDWRQKIAFYDAQPPQSYPQCYYITLGGTIGHFSSSDLAQRLRSSVSRPMQANRSLPQ